MKPWFFLGLMPLLAACLTSRDYGDRAYEAGKYNEALESYERAVSEGERDATMFVRAARASLNTGDFASAERYYSQALRNGAGLDVAQELAEFYVKTNNFVSAVRVYEYLIGQVEDPQPVYNNLGTALMYAAKPFEAESYLLIAQQMRPTAALPYLNLAVLYDEHMRLPSKALGFYTCYLGYAQERTQTFLLAQQRAADLQGKYAEVAEVVRCGEAYTPPVRGAQTIPKELHDGNTVVDVGLGGDDTGEPVKIDRMVKEPLTPPTASTNGHAQNGDNAWAERRWADVVRAYSNLTLAELDGTRRYRLGFAELELGRPAAAVSWLQLSLSASEDPATVEALIRSHLAVKDEASVRRLCDIYGPNPAYMTSLVECPKDKAP